MLKGNKGEWSEIYTLFKLLSEGNLHSGDVKLNKITDLIYPIIKIIRKEAYGDFEYIINSNIIIVSGNNKKLEIPITKFQEQTKLILTKIKDTKKGVFSMAEIETFLEQINCKTLKAKASVKTDIRIVIHDLKTNTKPELGFSIKSQLGRPSTLFNASKSTNFIYEINKQLNNKQIKEINNTKIFVDKFDKLASYGAKLKFLKIEKAIFKNNLILIDSYLPEIIAHLLELSSISNETSISSLAKKIKELNPMNYDFEFHHNFYEYKIKHFLTDIALGLMPSKVWKGKYDVTGGYLIIKKNGDIVAYHIYNKNEFENYLFENTRLIRASTKRHKFGSIYKENDKQKIKLNLQIRFIK